MSTKSKKASGLSRVREKMATQQRQKRQKGQKRQKRQQIQQSGSAAKSSRISQEDKNLMYKKELFYAKKLLSVLEKLEKQKKKEFDSYTGSSNIFKHRIQNRLIVLTTL